MNMQEFYQELDTKIQNVVENAICDRGEILYKPTMNLRYVKRSTNSGSTFGINIISTELVLQQQWTESYPDFKSTINSLRYDSNCETAVLLGAIALYDKKYGREEKWIDVPVVEED